MLAHSHMGGDFKELLADIMLQLNRAIRKLQDKQKFLKIPGTLPM